MIVAGIDFETQGSDPSTTNITEIGCCLYDSETKKKLTSLSLLVWEPLYPAQSPEIIELTGITDEMLRSKGYAPNSAFARLFTILEKAEIVFAHKESFDRVVMESFARRRGFQIPKKEWICTLTNFDWPAKYTCKKLSHLAYEHSIIVDPATLHRAENDVDLMMELVLTKYDFEKVLSYAREPWVYLRAHCIEPWKDGRTQVGIAQSLGFSWERAKYQDQPRFPKTWVARVKRNKVDDILKAVLASKSPFKIAIIEGVS